MTIEKQKTHEGQDEAMQTLQRVLEENHHLHHLQYFLDLCFRWHSKDILLKGPEGKDGIHWEQFLENPGQDTGKRDFGNDRNCPHHENIYVFRRGVIRKGLHPWIH